MKGGVYRMLTNKYIRCEKVPENIIAEAKVDKGE